MAARFSFVVEPVISSTCRDRWERAHFDGCWALHDRQVFKSWRQRIAHSELRRDIPLRQLHKTHQCRHPNYIDALLTQREGRILAYLGQHLAHRQHRAAHTTGRLLGCSEGQFAHFAEIATDYW